MSIFAFSDANAIVVDVDMSAEAAPKGSSPPVTATRRLVGPDEYDPGDDPAMVGGSVGFTSSKNYQSLSIRVNCTLPARPGDVEERTHVALALCKKVLAEQAGYLTELARALGSPAVIPEIVEFEGADLVAGATSRRT